MGKKQNAIYEPGELGQVRDRLGDIDVDEAKRMARILGGELGTEREPVESRHLRETVEVTLEGRRKKSRPAAASRRGGGSASPREGKERKEKSSPLDDPQVNLSISYFERIRMDRFAALPQFEIKSSMQMLSSFFSFMGGWGDYVNHRFTNRRMPAYYGKLERLVVSTRNLLPRNNAKLGERLKKVSPQVYEIIDTIRQWNIERIGTELAKMQARPRSVKVSEYADILRCVYRPIFVLEKLDTEQHIKEAYKLLCKLLYVESPSFSKKSMQALVRTAIMAYLDIRRSVHHDLHPLLMRFISDRWLPYDSLFLNRPRRLMAFLGVTEDDRIKPTDLRVEEKSFDGDEKEDDGEDAERKAEEEAADRAEADERTARIAAERRALEQSVKTLESLFPKAGWERLEEYPDLYPYFVSIYGLRRGYELMATNDPLQQVAVLMHVIEDLCSAFRYITFEPITGPDGNEMILGDLIGKITGNWRRCIDESLAKEYLPRLSEYCHMLVQSSAAGTSSFAKRVLNDLRWVRRLYFLPYYRFDSMGPPSFQKQEITAVYAEVRTFRKYLTIIAANIEKWNKSGGAAAKIRCEGIENPTAGYKFEIANPVSKRMDLLLPLSQRNNVHLLFFMLSAVTMLDYLVNSESSWAYGQHPSSYLFRTAEGKGGIPVFGVEERIDADHIFKESVRQNRLRQQAAKK